MNSLPKAMTRRRQGCMLHPMIKKALLTSAFILLSAFSQAAEVDHYTLPYEQISNSEKLLHLKVQDYLEMAIQQANDSGSCNEEVLYEKMRLYFNNHSQGQLAKDVIYDESFPSKRIKLGDSIFGEWSIFNGLLLGRNKAKESPLALGPIMKVGDQVIGTDKLEHLFGSGFLYFKRHHLKGKDLLKVLKRGAFYEKTILGGNFLATGVFSYGDLAANFNGMRFWNHVLQNDNDVLGEEENLGPYVSCKQGRWQKVKDIDLGAYFDDSFDESRNCSKFATSRGLEKYREAVEKIAHKRGSVRSCLSYTENNSWLTGKYDVPLSNGDPISHWIINENGHEQVSYFNEF